MAHRKGISEYNIVYLKTNDNPVLREYPKNCIAYSKRYYHLKVIQNPSRVRQKQAEYSENLVIYSRFKSYFDPSRGYTYLTQAEVYEL